MAPTALPRQHHNGFWEGRALAGEGSQVRETWSEALQRWQEVCCSFWQEKASWITNISMAECDLGHGTCAGTAPGAQPDSSVLPLPSSRCCKWILTCWELLSALLLFSWAFRRSSGNHPSAGSRRVPPDHGGFGTYKNEIKAPVSGEPASREQMSAPINVSLMCSSGVGSFGRAEVITTRL